MVGIRGRFLLGPDLFSGAFAVSFGEGSAVNLFVRLEGKKTTPAPASRAAPPFCHRLPSLDDRFQQDGPLQGGSRADR